MTKTILFILMVSIASMSEDTLQKVETTIIGSKKIVQIYFNGNHTTKAKTILSYLEIDTGMIYDSLKLSIGKKRLFNTNLFSKVNILPLEKNDGMYLYIIVIENFYYSPDYGGELLGQKYGVPNNWIRLRLGLTIQNFRGLNETFSIRTSVWDDRSLGIGWNKPMLPSPFLFGIGASIRDCPDYNTYWQRFTVAGRISGGMRLFTNTTIRLSVSPTYSRIDTARGNTTLAVFKEVYSDINWFTDNRNSNFDPQKGWAFSTNALVNPLVIGNYNRYLQLYSDFRFYHLGFFNNDRFAYRAQCVLRTNNGGRYKSLYIGGEGSIRGFGRDQFGMTAIMNDYALVSAEYRVTLLTLPEFDLWPLSDYLDVFKKYYNRVDGALILDAGHIWSNLYHPFTIRENAAGMGAGLRVFAPTLRISGSFDAVWGIPGPSAPWYVKPSTAPGWYLYLGTYY